VPTQLKRLLEFRPRHLLPADDDPDRKFLWKVLAALLLIAPLIQTYFLGQDYQLWDFRSAQRSGLALFSGLNPYDPEVVASSAFPGGPMISEMMYPYAPVTLLFFVFLAILPYQLSLLVFLCAQTAATLISLRSWQGMSGCFRAGRFAPMLAAVAAFGFPWFVAYAAGNVVLLELAMVSVAFLLFSRSRLQEGAVMIAFAALWKTTPILFLLVIPFQRATSGEKVRAMLLGVTFFIGIHLLSFGLCFDLFTSFASYGATKLYSQNGGLSWQALAINSFGLSPLASTSIQLCWNLLVVLLLLLLSRRIDGNAAGRLSLEIAPVVYLLISPRVPIYWLVYGAFAVAILVAKRAALLVPVLIYSLALAALPYPEQIPVLQMGLIITLVLLFQGAMIRENHSPS
jgi:hypothetical protein